VPKYEDVPGINPKYAAMIEAMDIYIGELMSALDEMGLAENTLILFSSDNGGINNLSDQAPFRAGKGSYYEGGVRVPTFVRWPARVKAGTKCDVPVSGIDFFPTFLQAAGAEKPEGKVLDGVSLMPLLTQSGDIGERALFWHFPIYLQRYSMNDEGRDPFFRTRPGSTMRFGKWKLHEYFEDGGIELYDLESDVGEKNNLAAAMPEKARELHAMLIQWRKELNAPVPTEPNPNYDPEYKPAPKGRKTTTVSQNVSRIKS
jgi:arylsulfatase A-like enzyme